MLRAVIFDLDETLAVSERDRPSILADAVDRVGAPPITREEYLEAHGRNLTGESREPIFADLLSEYDTDVDPAELAAAYREALGETIRPIEGAEELIEDLRERYLVGLLTNGPARAQRDKIARLGWEELFDAALVTGELAAGKPDPRAFEAVLDALDVDAGEAVYVGDKVEKDVEGAANVGMDAIQVLYEGGPDPDPRAVAHVDRSRLADDLPAVLDRLD